jgi:hypothetical protein
MDGFRTKIRRAVGFHLAGCISCLLLLSLFLFSTTPGFGGPKQDRFRGKVVYAGPKAISVQSLSNIYQVRMFNYTPALEKKVNAKRPPQGKIVTIYYLRGTETVVRID